MKRDYSLDFLKIIATAIIFMHHYEQFFYDSDKAFFYAKYFYWGRMVELFFIISGFIIWGYQEKIQKGLSFKEFYLKRAYRLLPITALASIVYEILIVLFKKHTGTLFMGTDLNLSGALFDAIGIQAGWAFANPMVNNPTWYISVLLLCYVVFWTVNRIARISNVNVCYIYIIVLFVGFGIKGFSINLPFLNEYSARGYCSFFVGVLLSNYLNSIKHHPVGNKYLVAIIGLLITAYGIFYYVNQNIIFDDYYWLVLVTFPSLIILFESPIAKKIFRWNGFELLAKTSFNMFMWHICIDIIIKYFMIRYPKLATIREWKMMIFMLVISEIVGVFSYYLIEKPISKRLKDYMNLSKHVI